MSHAILVLLICISFVGIADGQSAPPHDFSGQVKPVPYAKVDDGLPKQIRARGKIVDASPAGFYCGTLATAGTLKIELADSVEGYNDKNVYVVILCFAVEERSKLIGKRVELIVKKMTKFPYSFGVLLANSIDSNGTPFYLSTVEGVGGILKRIEIQ
jgi:hypothetical protein